MKRAKRHLKKKIVKRKPNLKRKPRNDTAPNVNTTPKQDQNTIRNMLLMRAGILSPGFVPQQYGNVNDKINTLQLTEQGLKDQNLRQKKEIEDLNKNIADLKKEKHEVTTEHAKVENEYDKLIEEVR